MILSINAWGDLQLEFKRRDFSKRIKENNFYFDKWKKVSRK